MLLLKTFSRLGVILVLLVSFNSCNTTQESSSELITIDVEKVSKKPRRSVMLSEFVDDIEYVKLETNSESLVGITSDIAVSEHYLLIYQHKPDRILLFSREGSYLHDIGSNGKGPEEYNSIFQKSLEISPDEKYILFSSYDGSIYLYNIDGSFHKRVRASTTSLIGAGYQNSENIVGYQKMFYLPEQGGHQLLYYDENLNITDSLIFSTRDTIRVRFMSMVQDNFHIKDEQIFFRQKLNDTIFRIDESKSVAPYLNIKLGSQKSPFLLLSEEQQKKYQYVYNFSFTDNFYFIIIRGEIKDQSNYGVNTIVYNRSNGEAFLLKEHPHIVYGEEWGTSDSPINDLDGLRPAEIFYFYKKDMCVQALQVADAKPYIESDDFDPTKLATDKYYNRIKKLLDVSDIEDNPIIRICYLK